MYEVLLDGSTVYACGIFTTIGGQPRNRVAALDVVTGAATAWDPNANAGVYVMELNGHDVVLGGDFTFVGGQTRNRLAIIDDATGLADFTWDANANASVYAIDRRGHRPSTSAATSPP